MAWSIRLIRFAFRQASSIPAAATRTGRSNVRPITEADWATCLRVAEAVEPGRDHLGDGAGHRHGRRVGLALGHGADQLLEEQRHPVGPRHQRFAACPA